MIPLMRTSLHWRLLKNRCVPLTISLQQDYSLFQNNDDRISNTNNTLVDIINVELYHNSIDDRDGDFSILLLIIVIMVISIVLLMMETMCMMKV